MRGKPRSIYFQQDQLTAGYKRGIRTRGRRRFKPLLFPTELACGGYRPVLSRYTHLRLLPGKSAPAGCDTGPLRENADKDLLTARRSRVAPNSIFVGPETPKAPISGS
jgi:hypothetical protein